MRNLSAVNEGDVAAYITDQKASGKPQSTTKLRAWQLRRWAATLPGSVRGVTTAELSTYLVGQGWSASTMYSVRATLRGFYAFLVASGRMKRSPAAHLPSIPRPRREPRPAPEDVIHRPLADERVQLMVDLGARQGLRRGEMIAIHSRDLIPDLVGWSLIVHGKGAKERTVPLHDDIAARILAHGPGWLFPSSRSASGHISASHAGTIVRQALDGWAPHSLRRRFATKVYRETHDLRAVQELLGHASIATTQLYVGLAPEDLRAAVRAAA